MGNRLKCIESGSLDPYYNLALEEHLLYCCREGERILYLWQNEKTVVLGRNQDAASECPLELLKRDGICLARRNSGGGAVYHDSGNLNYTFIARERDYDVPGQMEAVLAALRGLGFPAEFSGRNDILAEGRKVSGNAFFISGGSCCHHGTLMVDVDLNAVEKYLRPGADKLAARGVASVRSRVANLREFRPRLRLDELKEALRSSFGQVFGGSCEALVLSEADSAGIGKRREKFAAPRWVYGEPEKYEHRLSRRFSWGGVTLWVYVEQGVVADVRVDTDAMEPGLPEVLRERLLGVPYKKDALYQAVLQPDQEVLRPDKESLHRDQGALQPDKEAVQPHQAALQPDWMAPGKIGGMEEAAALTGICGEIAGWLLKGQLGG